MLFSCDEPGLGDAKLSMKVCRATGPLTFATRSRLVVAVTEGMGCWKVNSDGVAYADTTRAPNRVVKRLAKRSPSLL